LYNVAENTVIELRDMTGRLVYSRTIDSSQQGYELPMRELNLDRGMYVLSAKSGDQSSVEKIVIK
ncbi:MAG: T9SS type A sorting domain-containing protein, partial [Hymenobacteraceae bacterium]|nr:T9SS type A sorting domain-containing protein [Hymenobacteraceae bacterium]MDX5396363.1 T9SS type A sorting domain-containing protein [Hymenobacteraceae bacterium]MDX5443940.1 T9SS type A sorting domain-containing protein [Hymenobacteraceae bacterium]MDX5512425.1 T9SS type A sorting domain-containing protein [Hymenobacteraceae bacterium]